MAPGTKETGGLFRAFMLPKVNACDTIINSGGDRPHREERQETMGHILDTDFRADDLILVYCGGDCIFDGKVRDAGDGVKRVVDRSDWFSLDRSCEDHDHIFVAAV